ncbi:hypothetical protein [Verrucomicrobium spinosum]|nr:hypothetical protein [Verrucomicrobium spinosum]
MQPVRPADADAMAHLYQPLQLKPLCGLPHDTAAHPELLGKLALRREPL